jgi:hypothetical protein
MHAGMAGPILEQFQSRRKRMGDAKVDGSRPDGERSGESNLRGKSLEGVEHKNAPKGGADTVLRLDDEEDSLYNDGLELEDDSSPLTGINGRDDSTK